jgi:hypothetical protein
MNDGDRLALHAVLDRQSILDCIYRYCRGVDRFDRALLRSAYHIDAMDDHGHFAGPVEAFIDWVFDLHGTRHRSTQHMILNHRAELDGDQAHAESYFHFVGVMKETAPGADFPSLQLAGGRYIDRFERRNGVWAIAFRRCVVEWVGSEYPAQAKQWLLANCAARRDASDPSYDRPLAPASPVAGV